MSDPVTLKRKREHGSPNHTSAKRVCKDGPSTSDSPTLSTTADSKSNKDKVRAIVVIDSDGEKMNVEETTTTKTGDTMVTGTSTTNRNAPKVPFKPRPKIVKLTPHRPYPTVPTSSNATGPRSKRKEGTNKICVTRRTNLGAYLGRCRDVFVKEGYKDLYLSAMGAAIPHAVMLATSLPAILPYHRQEIKTSVTTGSVAVTDEIVPENDEDEDEMRTRTKATIEIVIRIEPEQGMDIQVTDQTIDSDSFSD